MLITGTKTGLFAIIISCGIASCAAAKTTCAVIDVAHTACKYVTVEYIDDDGKLQRQNVPASELRDAAMQARGEP
jgi:hypothetical protein